MHRFLEECDLPTVICRVLGHAVQHRSDTSLTLRSVAGEIVIAHAGHNLTQPLVALRKRGPRVGPAILRDGSGRWPVLTSGWLDLASCDAAPGDVGPRRYVKHHLPDIVCCGDWTLNRIFSGYTDEKLVERRAMPGVAD